MLLKQSGKKWHPASPRKPLPPTCLVFEFGNWPRFQNPGFCEFASITHFTLLTHLLNFASLFSDPKLQIPQIIVQSVCFSAIVLCVKCSWVCTKFSSPISFWTFHQRSCSVCVGYSYLAFGCFSKADVSPQLFNDFSIFTSFALTFAISEREYWAVNQLWGACFDGCHLPEMTKFAQGCAFIHLYIYNFMLCQTHICACVLYVLYFYTFVLYTLPQIFSRL